MLVILAFWGEELTRRRARNLLKAQHLRSRAHLEKERELTRWPPPTFLDTHGQRDVFAQRLEPLLLVVLDYICTLCSSPGDSTAYYQATPSAFLLRRMVREA